ncbi:hypothetical protein CFP56_016954 [Quercus suber]|uniref:Zinc knuckle CX2CX4HX4C domain-containing protein n=1 Tax=Quercus suber TaxID=58331 RepID=A0AAW0KM05_QUESU
MNKAIAEAMGRTLGTVEQIDASPTGECRGRYLRVRITLNINQPLCRGRMVNVGEMEPQWVSFQYERLPIFCYWCRHLNHDEKDCSLWTDSGSTLNLMTNSTGLGCEPPRPIFNNHKLSTATTNQISMLLVAHPALLVKSHLQPQNKLPRRRRVQKHRFRSLLAPIWLSPQTRNQLRYILQLIWKIWQIQIFSTCISRRLTMI